MFTYITKNNKINTVGIRRDLNQERITNLEKDTIVYGIQWDRKIHIKNV